MTQDEELSTIFDSLKDLVLYKNKQYGNAANKPLCIFANKCTYGSRLDEKLARVKNSDTLRKNDIVDIMGGLALICQEQGWTDFSEFKD